MGDKTELRCVEEAADARSAVQFTAKMSRGQSACKKCGRPLIVSSSHMISVREKIALSPSA